MIGTDTRDTERELIGATILAPDLTATIPLDGRHFTDPTHGVIWETLRALHHKHVQPTPALIAEEAKTRGRVDHATVVELIGLGIAANATTYAEQILQAHDKLELLGLADKIKHHALTIDTDAETIRDDARTTLDRIAKHATNQRHTWADIEPGIIDLIEHGGRHGLPTPWPDLDRHLDGLVGSRCYFIAARPGEGKSLMAQGLATHMATRHRKTVLFSSLEMSEADLGIRIVAAESGVSLDNLQKGNLTDDQWDRIGSAQVALQGMPLVIDDTPEQTMGHIRAAAIDLARNQNLGLITVDYLQLVKPADPKAPRENQVARISRDIKLLSRELDVPVVALTQLNRNSLSRPDKRPSLGDLRESGAQEQDGDIVILMNVDEETGELTIHVAKNRHGTKGNLRLQMWGHLAQLRNISRGDIS